MEVNQRAAKSPKDNKLSQITSLAEQSVLQMSHTLLQEQQKPLHETMDPLALSLKKKEPGLAALSHSSIELGALSQRNCVCSLKPCS